MGSQQAKQSQECQNFSEYYQTETSPSNKEMQNIEKLAAKLNQTVEELQLIKQFLEQRGYKFTERLLGKGGTSVVLRAENIQGQKLALKILKCSTKEQYLSNLQEYRLMRHTNSDHVIKVSELLEYKNNNKLIQFLAMEKCLYNLQSQLSGGKKMKKDQIYEICLHLTKGLISLHKQNILHLDIKPGNIVLGFDNKWKYIDLGLSQVLAQNQEYCENVQGLTRYYCSPEQYQLFYKLSKAKLGKSSDIYSLGLVFMELTGVKFSEAQIIEAKIKKTNFDHFFNPEFEEINTLLEKMLQYCPENRCSLSSIKHYLDQLNCEEGQNTTTVGTSSMNTFQFQNRNISLNQRNLRSKSNLRMENDSQIQDQNRRFKHGSMHDLSQQENVFSLSPKKNTQYQKQQEQNSQNQNFSHFFELRRSGSQALIPSEIQNYIYNQDSLSPVKRYLYPQKLEQIQQARNIISKKLSVADVFKNTSTQQFKDISPNRPKIKVVLPSLSKQSSKVSSPIGTSTKFFMPKHLIDY